MLRVLGQGGMGTVHLGRSSDGTFAAVKVIRADLAAEPEFRARFRQEVELASRVRSPRTVAVLAADPHAPAPWLATEYVPAPSLRDAVATHGPMPPDAVRALGVGLAEGLAAIHAVGVVHRDLKPGNVLLADDGPRIIDFGIARAADGTALTRTGTVIGTPGFIAPEQVLHHSAGPEADVFSLGGLLLYAATGRPPFGEGEPAVVLYRVLHVDANLDGVPQALVPVLTACLERDPARRPAPQAVAARLTGRDPAVPARARTTTTPPAAAPSAARRHGRAILAVVAVLAVFLVGGLALALRAGPGAAPTPPPTTGSPGASSPAPTPLPTPARPTQSAAPAPEDSTAGPSAPSGSVREYPVTTGFTTPSGNIACVVLPDGARCDIVSKDWHGTEPPRPPDCEGDFGDALAVSGAASGDFVCHGDTVFGSPTLAYGLSIRVGDALCVSRESGVECTRTSTRHGFTMSRTDYTLF